MSKGFRHDCNLARHEKIIAIGLIGISSSSWVKPVINSIILPAHAKTSDVQKVISEITFVIEGCFGFPSDTQKYFNIGKHNHQYRWQTCSATETLASVKIERDSVDPFTTVTISSEKSSKSALYVPTACENSSIVTGINPFTIIVEENTHEQ